MTTTSPTLPRWRLQRPLSPPVAVVAATALTGLDPLTAEARRAQQRMSRAAFLAQAALTRLLPDAGWVAADLPEVGFFLGVGASGGSVEQFERIMAVSLTDDGAWSAPRFNTAGLKACNPLYAFQLMNNFTLCHAAIAAGLGGPNAAIHSIGAGTWTALLEATAALQEGACLHAVVGGADDPTHPVTQLSPSVAALPLVEGAALLALSSITALPAITRAAPAAAPLTPLTPLTPLALLTHLSATPAPDPWALTPDDSPCTRTLTWCADPALRVNGPQRSDLSSALGDGLATTPALLWAHAVGALSPTTHTVHARWSDLAGFTYAATFTRPHGERAR